MYIFSRDITHLLWKMRVQPLDPMHMKSQVSSFYLLSMSAFSLRQRIFHPPVPAACKIAEVTFRLEWF
ncbi:hypothetical protein OROMI_002675 [Orobanche minor]